jgi:hypothetical protein
MPWKALWLAWVLGSGATACLQAQCEPSPPVRAVLAAVDALVESELPEAARQAQGKAILAAGLAENPGDYFLMRRGLLGDLDGEPWVHSVEALSPAPGGALPLALLRAENLVSRDTPAALRAIEDLVAASPQAAPPYLELARALAGRLKDPARQQAALASFLRLCPAPFERGALRTVLDSGSSAEIATLATALRRRIDANGEPPLFDGLPEVWSLELKAARLAQQPQARRRIAADLRRLEENPASHELAGLTLLRSGYTAAANPSALAAVEAEIVARYPRSLTARNLLRETWARQHPQPPAREVSARLEHRRAELAAARTWRTLRPADAVLDRIILLDLQALPEAQPEEIVAAAQTLLADSTQDPLYLSLTRVEFEVADVYVQRRAHLEEVPKLADLGLERWVRWSAAQTDDRDSGDPQAAWRETHQILELERARLLIAAYAALGQPAKIAAVDAELAAQQVTSATARVAWLMRRAEAAEARGLLAEALTLERSAAEAAEGTSMSAAAKAKPRAAALRLAKLLGVVESPSAGSRPDPPGALWR